MTCRSPSTLPPRRTAPHQDGLLTTFGERDLSDRDTGHDLSTLPPRRSAQRQGGLWIFWPFKKSSLKIRYTYFWSISWRHIRQMLLTLPPSTLPPQQPFKTLAGIACWPFGYFFKSSLKIRHTYFFGISWRHIRQMVPLVLWPNL